MSFEKKKEFMESAEIVSVSQPKLKVNEAEIRELKHQYDMFRKLQETVLEDGIDFGFPAGKKSRMQKPSLYKSGAEKLTRLFNLMPKFEIIDFVKSSEYVMYEFKCSLYTRDDMLIGEGFGACNSKEKEGWDEVPLKFQNNILKMAKKRAHVDAVLTGLGASNVFTQDVEDMDDEDFAKTSYQSKKSEISEKQMDYISNLIGQYAEKHGKTREEVVQGIINKYNINDLNNLTRSQASELIDLLLKGVKKGKTQKTTKNEVVQEEVVIEYEEFAGGQNDEQ